MILGLRTALYAAPDLARGRRWYAEVLRQQPYFDQPFYVGFRVGGFELGLVPDAEAGSGGLQVLWGVDDLEAELARLWDLGACVSDPLREVGDGIRTASLYDPFGNRFGLIENPHFDVAAVR
jgi:predicted enzyme related to lactoylglutathione lyase